MAPTLARAYARVARYACFLFLFGLQILLVALAIDGSLGHGVRYAAVLVPMWVILFLLLGTWLQALVVYIRAAHGHAAPPEMDIHDAQALSLSFLSLTTLIALVIGAVVYVDNYKRYTFLQCMSIPLVLVTFTLVLIVVLYQWSLGRPLYTRVTQEIRAAAAAAVGREAGDAAFDAGMVLVPTAANT